MPAETYDEDEDEKSDEATKDSLAEEKSILPENNYDDSSSTNFDIAALEEIKVTKFIDGSYNIKTKEKKHQLSACASINKRTKKNYR